MQKSSIAIVAVSLALALSACAKLENLSSILDSGNKAAGGSGKVLGSDPGKILGGTSGGSDLGVLQDRLVRHYMAAGQDVIAANRLFAEAIGVRVPAAGHYSPTAESIRKQDEAISAIAEAIATATQGGAALKGVDAKMKYARGLTSLVSGMKKYKDMGGSVKSFASGLSSSPMALLNNKLDSATYIVSNLPGSLSNISGALKNAIDFARKNGVEIPANVAGLF